MVCQFVLVFLCTRGALVVPSFEEIDDENVAITGIRAHGV